MKSKLSMKVLGIVVTLATLASLLVGLSTVPVSAAAPGALSWTATASPSEVGYTLTSHVTINAVAAAADGMTVFAWDGTAGELYKSTNGGASWGTPVPVTLASPLVAIKVSPEYATDSTVVLADASEVFVSANGGTSFNAATLDLSTQLETGSITSMDVGYYYGSPTSLSILLGVSAAGAGLISNVLMWTAGTYTWAAVGNLTKAGVGGGAFDPQVLAVMFSPSTATDAEIMAVYTGGGNTYLASHYGANSLAWNAYIPALAIVASATTTNATIAVGSDYVGNTSSPILVSLEGAGAGGIDNIYKITGRSAGTGAATNLLVGGTGVNVEVPQIVVDGTATAGTVLWTVAGSPTLKVATGGPTTFTVGSVSKQPSDNIALTGQAYLAVGGTTIFASIDSTAGVGGSVSRSTNGGVSFDNVGLIDVGAAPGNVYPVDLNVVNANTMFLILHNPDGAYAAMADSVFKTADAGATWVRIWNGAAALKTLSSPAYATDSTIVIITGTNSTPMSTNGGGTFSTPGVPVAATTGLMINGTTYFVGGAAGAFYKNTSFLAATGLGAGAIISIALNPKDTTNATVAVGDSNGVVYTSTNGGVAFTMVGTAAPGGVNANVAYGPDGTLYAGTAGGVWSWNGTAWVSLSGTAVSDVVLSGDNTLYASVPAAGGAVIRSLKPTATSAALAEVCQLNTASSTIAFNVAATAMDVDIISGATANSLYVLDNTVVQTGYVVKGGIYGLSDTLITPIAITAPKNNAKITDVTSTVLSWPAVTGANYYYVTLNGTEDTVGKVAASANPTYTAGVTAGSVNTWSVRVAAVGTGNAGTFFSRPSATATFTTALPAVTPLPAALVPAAGAVSVDPTNLTFTWPAVTGAGVTGYNFVLAEGDVNTPTNHFAIIDYSDTTDTNAITAKETLKYDTTYYWEVQPFTANSTGAWVVNFFTTMPEPTVTTTTPVTPVITTTSIVINQPTPTTLTITNSTTSTQPIPSYLLWAVIAVGAVLVIAVIVLIVRTRRMP